MRDHRLTVIEAADAYFVAEEGDLDQWLVRFERGHPFPAREWAENLVQIFNARVAGAVPTTLAPGERPASYHPRADGGGA